MAQSSGIVEYTDCISAKSKILQQVACGQSAEAVEYTNSISAEG